MNNQLTCGPDARPPFGTEDMRTVIDRVNNSFKRNLSGKRYWLSSTALLDMGVFVSSKEQYGKKMDKNFRDIVRVAERGEGGRSLAYELYFDRKTTNPKNGFAVAGRDRLVDFAAKILSPDFPFPAARTIADSGFYWALGHTDDESKYLHIHPFLDVDILTDDDDFDKPFHFVTKGVGFIQTKFQELHSRGELPYEQITPTFFYNCRPKNNKMKHSFHIHWPALVMARLGDLKTIVRQANEFVKVGNIECYELVLGDAKVFDIGVYTKYRKFRLPFCGKFGDKNAAQKPIKISKLANGKWAKTFERVVSWQAMTHYIDTACLCTLFPNNYVKLDNLPDERGTQGVLPHSMLSVQAQRRADTDVIAEQDDDPEARDGWLGFWLPILEHTVLPLWTEFRSKESSKKGVSNVITVDKNMTFAKAPQRLADPRFPGSFVLKYGTDTYCEHDTGSTPYRHKAEDNHVDYIVDLANGRIAQRCSKCSLNPGRDYKLRWHSFISARDLMFKIAPVGLTARHTSDIVSPPKQISKKVQFFLTYFQSEVRFCAETKSVFAFNPQTRIWEQDDGGNSLLLRKQDQLNHHYEEYCQAKIDHTVETVLRKWAEQTNTEVGSEEYEEKKEKEDKKANKELRKIKPFWETTTAKAREDLHKTVGTHSVDSLVVDKMEPLSSRYKVAMKDGVCYDLETGEFEQIRPEYYFTSYVAAHQDYDAQVEQEVHDWQRKVCCGDEDLQIYKYRVFGVAMTMLGFDRSVYVAMAIDGKNGKGAEATLMDSILKTEQPFRAGVVSKEYLTQKSQDNKTADQADSIMSGLLYKTFFCVDEMRQARLDNSLLKTIASSDTTTARVQFSKKQVSIELVCTPWLITNAALQIDYDDGAMNDRLRIIPYNARWVKDVAQAKATIPMGDPKSNHIYQEDNSFKTGKLVEWRDAFVGICLRQLHLFIKENKTAAGPLPGFPIPRCVVAKTEQVSQKQRPWVRFVKVHMGKTILGEVDGAVDDIYTQFKIYAKNEGNRKAIYMDKLAFCDALERASGIRVHVDDDGFRTFKGWKQTVVVKDHDPKITADRDAYAPSVSLGDYAQPVACISDSSPLWKDQQEQACKRARLS